MNQSINESAKNTLPMAIWVVMVLSIWIQRRWMDGWILNCKWVTKSLDNNSNNKSTGVVKCL